MGQRSAVCRLAIAVSTVVSMMLSAGAFTPIDAQQFSGTLRGTVQDSTGAVVADADVTITSTTTNEKYAVKTDAEGRYVAPQLKPGFYNVTVAKTGFKSAAIDEVKLDVQQVRGVDVTLELGQTSELVTVVGRTGTIETTSSTVSQTIENKRLVDLPLNGRNPFSLATLAPGVAPAPGSSPFISGGRNATSEVTIDGVSNVNAENNVSILDLNYTPSVDAVQEFSVQTNAVSAQFGRLGGGVINLITKSGSNAFHATAFGFGRNSKLDATNFFTNRAGQRPGSFKRNQFGGNVGGPVTLPGYNGADSTFFFVNYEGLRQESGAVSTLTVPLPEWRNGDFSNLRNSNGQPIILYDPATTRPDPNNPGSFIRDAFPGNTIPQNRISSVGRALAQVPGRCRTRRRRTRSRRPATTSCPAPSRATRTASIHASTRWSATSGACSSATPIRTKTARCSTASRTWPARRVETAPPTRRRTACRSTTTSYGRPHCCSTCATD